MGSAQHLDNGLTYEFLAAVNQPAAAQTVRQLTAAPTSLLTNSRIGERLEGHYEMRYEIAGSTLYMLRLWHTREDR